MGIYYILQYFRVEKYKSNFWETDRHVQKTTLAPIALILNNNDNNKLALKKLKANLKVDVKGHTYVLSTFHQHETS